MGKRRKVYDRILSGQSDKNIPFEQTRTLLRYLGFNERVSGDHYIFEKPGVDGLVNIQPTRESKCKPYQVKQIRRVLLDYKIEL